MGTQLPQRGTAPAQLSTHVCCGQTAGWIKMPFGRKLVLRPGDIVLDGYQLPHKRGDTAAPTFGPCLSWPNDWVNQDATWYGGGSRPRPHCVRWGPSCPLQKRVQPPIFGPLWPNGWMDQGATWYVLPQKWQSSPHFLSMSIVAKQLRGSRCHLLQR